MEYIDIKGNEPLAQAIERANAICIEPIRCHWDGTLFTGNREIHKENCTDVDDLRFKLGFDHIELLNSTMEEKQNVLLDSSIGNLKTLTMTFIFKLSDTKINGKIRICSVLNRSLESTYKLHLTKVKVKSIVGLYIAEDSYRVNHVIHELIDASISLMYKKDSKMVPVYNKIQDKHIKHSLVQYIVNNCAKHAIVIIEDKLKSAFDLTSVSISLGSLFSHRDTFRLHTKKMKVAFNNLVDEIIDSTNLLLIKKVPKIALPNISVILNFKKDEKKSFHAWKNLLTGFNFLIRKKSASVCLENDLVVVYAPVDFADLNIQYKHYAVKYGDLESKSTEIQEHYKTEGSYLTISLRKLGQNKVDLNLLEFKIVNFILLDSDNQSYIDASVRSWINSALEFKVAPVIEETFEKYLRIAMEHEKFSILAMKK